MIPNTAWNDQELRGELQQQATAGKTTHKQKKEADKQTHEQGATMAAPQSSTGQQDNVTTVIDTKYPGHTTTESTQHMRNGGTNS